MACICSLASGGLYFIKSSQNSSCPPEQICLTLSQLADYSTKILENRNLTLRFLSGNHMIYGKLSAGNLDVFSINVETVNVTCTNQSGSFDIGQTTSVSIKNLHLIDCGEIFVEHVSQFTLKNTTFHGTTLVFNQTIYIVNCLFINCRGSSNSFLNLSIYRWSCLSTQQ